MDKKFFFILGIVVVTALLTYFATPHGSQPSSPTWTEPDTLNVVVSIYGAGSIEEAVEKSFPGYTLVTGGPLSSFALGEKSTATTLRLVIARPKRK